MNNNIFKSISIVMLMFVLSGCSSMQCFIVSNSSNSEIIVNYQLSETRNGSPIFTNDLSLYKLTASKEIDWSSSTVPVDMDSSSTGFKLKIPANHAVVFGRLMNRQYGGHNQSDQGFNLKEMEVIKNRGSVRIRPANFDTHFKKINGDIRLDIN